VPNLLNINNRPHPIGPIVFNATREFVYRASAFKTHQSVGKKETVDPRTQSQEDLETHPIVKTNIWQKANFP
jgi:hypothetical protein